MFRQMRRFKQQIPKEECIQILRQAPRGVLAVLGDDAYPYALPINFVYDDETGHLFFHCAKEGYKLDAVRRHDKVSFCVYDQGFRREGEWSLNIRSVIVFGRIREAPAGKETERRVRQLGMKYYPDAESVEKEMAQTAARVLCLELVPEHMTGKLVNES